MQSQPFSQTMFGNLPRELRNEIYHHALEDATPAFTIVQATGSIHRIFHLSTNEEGKDVVESSCRDVLALFQTSRQIYTEVKDTCLSQRNVPIIVDMEKVNLGRKDPITLVLGGVLRQEDVTGFRCFTLFQMMPYETRRIYYPSTLLAACTITLTSKKSGYTLSWIGEDKIHRTLEKHRITSRYKAVTENIEVMLGWARTTRRSVRMSAEDFMDVVGACSWDDDESLAMWTILRAKRAAQGAN